MKHSMECNSKIIDLSEYRIHKIAEQIDECFGTERSIELEEELRWLLREKKRKEKLNRGTK